MSRKRKMWSAGEPELRRPQLGERTFKDARPLENAGPFDAMLRKTRSVGNGANGKGGGRGEHVEAAFVAGGDGGEDHTSLSFES